MLSGAIYCCGAQLQQLPGVLSFPVLEFLDHHEAVCVCMTMPSHRLRFPSSTRSFPPQKLKKWRDIVCLRPRQHVERSGGARAMFLRYASRTVFKIRSSFVHILESRTYLCTKHAYIIWPFFFFFFFPNSSIYLFRCPDILCYLRRAEPWVGADIYRLAVVDARLYPSIGI